MKTVLTFVALLLVTAGCVSSEEMRLDQVETKRIYQVPKEDLINVLRLYIRNSEYNSYWMNVGTTNDDIDRRLHHSDIWISPRVGAIDSSRTLLEVEFKFSESTRYPSDRLSQRDEQILVGCYQRLFSFLDDYFPGKVIH